MGECAALRSSAPARRRVPGGPRKRQQLRAAERCSKRSTFDFFLAHGFGLVICEGRLHRNNTPCYRVLSCPATLMSKKITNSMRSRRPTLGCLFWTAQYKKEEGRRQKEGNSFTTENAGSRTEKKKVMRVKGTKRDLGQLSDIKSRKLTKKTNLSWGGAEDRNLFNVVPRTHFLPHSTVLFFSFLFLKIDTCMCIRWRRRQREHRRRRSPFIFHELECSTQRTQRALVTRAARVMARSPSRRET